MKARYPSQEPKRQKKYRKEYYQKNKKRIIKQHKAYAAKDPERWKKYRHDWYLKNRKYMLAHMAICREEVRKFIRKKKDVPCTDCLKRYPYYVMDFDHLRDKKVAVGSMLNQLTIDRVADEIDKCEVVCANCHRIRTHKRRIVIERMK